MKPAKRGTTASSTRASDAGEPLASESGVMARVLAHPRACALLLGGLTVAGFAPFDLFALPVATLAALLALIERARSPRHAASIGFCFGLGFFLGGVSWVYVSLNEFGAMPAPIAAITTFAFCAYLALYPAIAAALTKGAAPAWARRCLAFPGAWVGTEWVRGWLFTGFPWLALGYSQAPSSPLAGLAPLLGVHGVGLATAACAGMALHAMTTRDGPRAIGTATPDTRGRTARWVALVRAPALWGLLALVVASFALGKVQWTQPSGEPFEASLLQGNVAQDMKWRPELVHSTLETYRAMIEAAPGRLIVLPETALPVFLQNLPSRYLEDLEREVRRRGADVLIGLPEYGAGRDYYNSVMSFGSASRQFYRKVHLVPFGEFVPLRPLLAPIVESLAIPLTDFGRGSVDQQPLAVAGERVAVNICYEDAFGDEIIRQLPQATLLVNVSNVAWFGRSLAPMQHLQIAQMRARETGRTMLRATNTGMTAAIGPRGEILAVAPQFAAATVTVRVQGYNGATPYVRLGDGVALGLALAALGLALAAGRGTWPRPGQTR